MRRDAMCYGVQLLGAVRPIAVFQLLEVDACLHLSIGRGRSQQVVLKCLFIVQQEIERPLLNRGTVLKAAEYVNSVKNLEPR